MTFRIAPGPLLLFSAVIAATLSALLPAPAKPATEFLPRTVGILLRFDRRPGALFVKQLRRQVEYIFRPAGLDLRWEVLDGDKPSGAYNRTLQVEMRGRCNPIAVNEPHTLSKLVVPLGWTYINDGEVMPSLVVDCDAIAGVADQARGQFTNSLMVQNTFLRLIGRVMAHEMLHALLAAPEHRKSAFTRAHLLTSDLIAAPRLGAAEVQRLRQALYRAPEISVAKAPER